MGKRLLSLCMALALCLGLLPATALAAAPSGQVIYVGNVNVTSGGYWTTGNDGTVTVFTGEGTPADNFIHYDATNNVLTLHNAAIKKGLDYSESIQGGTYIPGSAIGVFNQNDASKLTIQLEGSNAIENVSTGIYVLAHSSSTGDASLTITGSGSLDTSGSYNPAIKVQSNGGDATLSIENAKVTATASSSGGGVLVQSKNNSSVSLTVEGGSLTATGTGSGNYGAGIQLLFGSGDSGSGTPSLNVSNNAIVRASGNAGGIASNASAATPSGTGIVFDGGTGTVYGSVTLQEDLEIGEGESLTIPDGASLNTGSHEVIVNGGTLTGGDKITGTVKYAPTITTESLPNGTVNEEYSQTLAATGSDTITWSVTSGSLPDGVNLSGNAISGTPTTAGPSTFTVTATNAYGSASREFTLTISAPTTIPVTGVSLNKTSTELTVGQSETLTATVEPSDATNQNVTWSSSAPGVATVSNGVVTAVTPGTATITVTTADGGKTATCTVTVNPVQYTVTVQTDGNGTASASPATAPAGTTVTLTADPDSGYHFERWEVVSGGATISGNQFTMPAAHVTVRAIFDRNSSGSSRPTPSLSDRAIDDIRDARPGDTVEITLRPGRTTLEREVFEALAGQDITLEIDAGDGVLWTVNGLDIPEDTRLHDLNLDVNLGDSDIPARVINAVTGTVDTIQLSLKHDGEFGFTMALSAPLGRENADLWANLYWYNERSEELEFQQAVRIGRDGTAEFALDHASDYAIVIDTDSHEPVELPFRDVPENVWYADAAAYVYKHGLMAGTSATTFAPEVTTSRAMIVTILWRLAGSPQVDYLMDYSDVDPTAYYGEAIRWAASEGIVGGYGGGVFGPDDPITREQLAAMLWRFAQTEDYNVSVGEDTNILSYTDAFDVAEYAIPAMQWACGAGVINGTGDGSTLSPQGEATRAQAAVMLMRFCERYEEN